jgi:hypothetical protein
MSGLNALSARIAPDYARMLRLLAQAMLAESPAEDKQSRADRAAEPTRGAADGEAAGRQDRPVPRVGPASGSRPMRTTAAATGVAGLVAVPDTEARFAARRALLVAPAAPAPMPEPSGASAPRLRLSRRGIAGSASTGLRGVRGAVATPGPEIAPIALAAPSFPPPVSDALPAAEPVGTRRRPFAASPAGRQRTAATPLPHPPGSHASGFIPLLGIAWEAPDLTIGAPGREWQPHAPPADPFADDRLEDSLANLLERTAMSAGVDL